MTRGGARDLRKGSRTTERAPLALRTHLLVNAQNLTSYLMVRAAVESFVTAGRRWDTQDSGQEAMDVDALYGPKGKGKDNKGKARGKGKDKGKAKGKDGKTKGDHDEEKPERFAGYCGRCGKWGHRQRDCWSSKAGHSLEAAE